MKVMDEAPKWRSRRLMVTERGIPSRGRPPRERSAYSSRGSHAPPGRLGKPATGRRGTGGQTLSRHAVREMRSAKVVLNVTYHLKVPRTATGEPDAWKLARPVRRGEVGKVPRRATRRPPTQLSNAGGEQVRLSGIGWRSGGCSLPGPCTSPG